MSGVDDLTKKWKAEDAERDRALLIFMAKTIAVAFVAVAAFVAFAMWATSPDYQRGVAEHRCGGPVEVIGWTSRLGTEYRCVGRGAW